MSNDRVRFCAAVPHRVVSRSLRDALLRGERAAGLEGAWGAAWLEGGWGAVALEGAGGAAGLEGAGGAGQMCRPQDRTEPGPTALASSSAEIATLARGP